MRDPTGETYRRKHNDNDGYSDARCRVRTSDILLVRQALYR